MPHAADMASGSMRQISGGSVLIAAALLGAGCTSQTAGGATAAESGSVPDVPTTAAGAPATSAPITASPAQAESAPVTAPAASNPAPAAEPSAMPNTLAAAGGSSAAGAGAAAGSSAPPLPTAQAGSGGAAGGQSESSGAADSSTPEIEPLPDTGKGVGSTAQRAGTLTATFKISDVPPGSEAHKCVIVELPNTAPGWVDRIHAKMSGGSHHLIVDRASKESTAFTEAKDCPPTTGSDETRLWLAQQPDSKLTLPDGVAYPIEAHQHVFLQLHYFNTGDKSSEITASVELHKLTEDVKPIEAKSLFTGSTAITLLPQQMGSTTFFMEPGIEGAPVRHVFALSSHTHKLGIRTTIERVVAQDAPETKPIHESTDWAEPPLTVFEKPLEFKGDDGLRLTCRYMNTTKRTVSFGTSTEDEMCFMWMYYFER